MRVSVYVLAAIAAAGFVTATAQNTGNSSATPGAQAPVRQATQQSQPTTTQQTQPNSTATTQQTVRPPDSARTDRTTNPTTTNNAANNRAQQDRVPPASRRVGTTGSRPDCSKLRGLEKAECERRDTVRDDLPAGVTTTQPKSPQQ